MTAEQRAEARGLTLRKSRGKAFVDVTIDGEKLTFDGPNADDVLNDAIVYLDIADSDGVYRIDYAEDSGLYSVTLKGTGEVFENESPVDAFEQAKKAHEDYLHQEKLAEEARAAQEKADKPAPKPRSRKPKNGDAVDDKGNLRPTQAEADAASGPAPVTPLATELDEKGWEPEFKPVQATPPSSKEQKIVALQMIATGIMQFADALAKGD